MALHSINQDKEVLSKVTRWGEHHKWLNHGAPTTCHGDRQAAFQAYTEVYFLAPKPENEFKITSAKDNLGHCYFYGRKSEKKLGWCDLLYMVPPSLALIAKASG